jgi:hypothetical protein
MSRRRDSAVGVATNYGLGDRRNRRSNPGGLKNFSSSRCQDRLWSPPRETDHSPPAGAEVKNMWIYTSTPLYGF